MYKEIYEKILTRLIEVENEQKIISNSYHFTDETVMKSSVLLQESIALREIINALSRLFLYGIG